MRYTRTALGLLTRQYRSVLRKCWLINSGIWGWVMRTAATGAAAITLGATVLPNEAEASMTLYVLNDTYNKLVVTSGHTASKSTLGTFVTTSDLSSYATQTWVNNKGYITSSALNGYATQTWVGQQGYLTSSSLSGYATQTWVGQQGYITASSLPTKTSQLTNDSGFITKDVSDLTNYYRKLRSQGENFAANDNTATTIFKKAI